MKRFSRRQLLKAVGLSGAAALASACQPAGTPQVVEKVVKETVVVEKEVTAAPIEAQPVTLRVATYHKPSKVDDLDVVYMSFKEMAPHISLEIELIPWAQYWDKLLTVHAGGNPYDLFVMNGPHFPYHAFSETLLDLTPFIERDGIDMRETFPDYLVDLYTWRGKMYGLPWWQATIGLYYNKTMFEEAGVPLPDGTWDWDGYLETALALKQESGGRVTQYGTISPSSRQTGWYPLVLQNGGELFNEERTKCVFDSPEGIEAFQFAVSLILEHRVAPTNEAIADMNARDTFMSGRVAMYPSGSWEMDSSRLGGIEDFVWDITPLPKKVRRACAIHGSSMVASAITKHPEEAWMFAKYETTTEIGEAATSTFNMPGSRRGVAYYVKRYTEQGLNANVFLEAMDYGYWYPTSLYAAEWQAKQDSIVTEMWAGDKEVEPGVKEMVALTNEILAREAEELKNKYGSS